MINEQGQLCKPGEIGELVHRGPTVSMGYWGRPEDTARALRPNPLLPPELGDCERVCYSGDLVKMDEDGFLYYVGRRDTMIKSSGFRVSPTEVEEVLFQSGELRQAAVIGIPDEALGQSIKAFVVPRDGGTVDAESPDRLLRGANAAVHGSESGGSLERVAEDHQRQSRLPRPATPRRTLMAPIADLIQSYFPSDGGELTIGGIRVSELAARYGTPLFVYDRAIIEKKWDRLRAALPAEFSIHYSVKANPAQALLKCILAKGAGLEIASGGEFCQALAAGCPAAKDHFRRSRQN